MSPIDLKNTMKEMLMSVGIILHGNFKAMSARSFKLRRHVMFSVENRISQRSTRVRS